MSTPRMTIGLNLLTMPPLFGDRILTSVARLSRLDVLWVSDHLQGQIPSAMLEQTFPWAASQIESPHAFFDYQVFMGALAAHAGRLRLGVGVTDPIRHHPVLLAQAMLTLAHLCKRPPILGIGAGERENIEPYGLDFSEPVGRLEEALQIIRLCFSHQGPLDFGGKHYRLDHAILDLRAPKGKTPQIWIGGQGPRMLLQFAPEAIRAVRGWLVSRSGGLSRGVRRQAHAHPRCGAAGRTRPTGYYSCPLSLPHCGSQRAGSGADAGQQAGPPLCALSSV